MGGHGQCSSDYPWATLVRPASSPCLQTLVRWHQGDCHHPRAGGFLPVPIESGPHASTRLATDEAHGHQYAGHPQAATPRKPGGSTLPSRRPQLFHARHQPTRQPRLSLNRVGIRLEPWTMEGQRAAAVRCGAECRRVRPPAPLSLGFWHFVRGRARGLYPLGTVSSRRRGSAGFDVEERQEVALGLYGCASGPHSSGLEKLKSRIVALGP